MVPTFCASNSSGASSAPLLQLPPMQSTSPAYSYPHPFAPGPTPRPSDSSQSEGAGYFASTPSPSPSTDVDQFIHALSHLHEIQQASVATFLSWRPSHPLAEPEAEADLASSLTSHSSGVEGEAGVMPTVARAQGGGEWEAGLSRRLAKRRQSSVPTDSASTSNRHGPSTTKPHVGNAGKRKSSTSTSKHISSSSERRKENTEPSSCGPLFPSDPFGSGSGPSRPGLGDLFEKTFGGLRRRWKWGMVAVTALALVAGWNWMNGV